MRNRIAKLVASFGRLLTFWRKPAVATPSVAVANEHAPVVGALALKPSVEVAPRPVVSANKRENDGVKWHWRAAILDRLDEYMDCMRRVRRVDHLGYRMVSRLGLAVPADLWLNPDNDANVARRSVEKRVTFGGCLMAGTDDSDWVTPSFVYFSKVATPSRVELFAGDIYSMTVVYDSRRNDDLLVPCRCHVGIDAHGVARILKELVPVESRIVPRISRRGGRSRRGEPFTLTATQWRYPSWVRSLDLENGELNPTKSAIDLFWMAYLTARDCQSSIIVRVRSGNLTAAFGIDAPRAKYFFADRDASLVANDGKRKRIFHSVVAHDRAIDSVRTIRVRPHYRGLRHFDWNGYSIGIVFPDNNAILDFDKAGTYEDDINDTSKRVGEAELASIVDEVLSR